MEQTETDIDALLREHLHAELEGLPGRTEVFFVDQMSREATGRRGINQGWKIRTAATIGAIAATLCIASGLFAYRNKVAVKVPAKPVVIAASHPVRRVLQASFPYERSIAYRTVDAGPGRMKDSSPARALRREVVETLRWYDPEHREQMQVTVPSEEVVLIKMPAF